MKKLFLIGILLSIIGCEDDRLPDFPTLDGIFSGQLIMEYGEFAPDTSQVYVTFQKAIYSFYYINISKCAFGG